MTTSERPREPSAIAPSRGPTGLAGPILLVFLASGATGLMLEVVWSRMLVGLFGSTTWGVLTVLVVFMGGLGLGGILFGWRASATDRPLRLYGRLEVEIGLYSLTVPWLFEGVGNLYLAATRATGAGSAVRVLAAVLALGIPTTLMGGTLPVLTRVVARAWDRPGRAAGVLYAANTLGAVVGCFATGFVLILWLGLSATNALAAAIDIALGLAMIGLDRRRPPEVPEVDPAGGSEVRPRADARWAMLIAGLSGFCGLAYEVLWTRGLLATLTESTTYAFTLMLTVFLLGHAMGSGLASRAVDDGRGGGWRRLGLSQVMAGLTSLLTLPLLVMAQGPIEWVRTTPTSTFWTMIVPFQLALCLAVMLIPAGFLGASFAFAARLSIGEGRSVGTSTGRLYAVNTAGSIAGAIVAAGWLVPRFGTQGALIALGVAQAVPGGLAYLLGGRGTAWHARLGTLIALGALVGVAVALNAAFPMAMVYARKEPGRLVDAIEGPGATVTVHQRQAGDRVININSVNVAGTNRVLRTTQKLQAHLPLLLHPAPRSVLQIGFGAGGTCRSVALHREVTSIDVAEISPEVLLMARRWFADVNRGVLDDPRVHVRVVDARSEMAVSDRTYDLILSDSIHPRFRGNSTLYTRDYFALCARRLNPGGLVSSWLPLYGMSVDDLRSILKSFQSVFPHVQIWYPNAETNENTIIIGSPTPIEVDWMRLTSRLADPPVAADLAEVEIRGPFALLDFFLMGDGEVAAFSATGRLNTDDRPSLEFLAPRTIHRQIAWLANFQALRAARGSVVPIVRGASPEVLAELRRWEAGTGFKLKAQSEELKGDLPEAIRAYAEGLAINPDDRQAAIRMGGLQRVQVVPDGEVRP